MVIVIYALVMACVATLGRMDIPREKTRKPRSFQTSNTPNRISKYFHRYHSRNKEYYNQPTNGFQVTLGENDFFVTENFLKEHWNIKTTYQPSKRDYSQFKNSLEDKKTILQKSDSFILQTFNTTTIATIKTAKVNNTDNCTTPVNACSTVRRCKKKKTKRTTCPVHPRTPKYCVTVPPKCQTTNKTSDNFHTTKECTRKHSDHSGHTWKKYFKKTTKACICRTTQNGTTVGHSNATSKCKTTYRCKTTKCRRKKVCRCNTTQSFNCSSLATVTSKPAATSSKN